MYGSTKVYVRTHDCERRQSGCHIADCRLFKTARVSSEDRHLLYEYVVPAEMPSRYHAHQIHVYLEFIELGALVYIRMIKTCVAVQVC